MKSKMIYIKSVLILFIVVFIFLMLRTDRISEKNISDIQESIVSSINTDKVQVSSSKDLLRNIGLSADDYDGFLYYSPISSMDVDELLIIKLSSIDQAETVEDAIDTRIDSQLNNFQGYGAKQCQLLNNAIEKTYGNYVFYAVSEDASDLRNVFTDNLY